VRELENTVASLMAPSEGGDLDSPICADKLKRHGLLPATGASDACPARSRRGGHEEVTSVSGKDAQ